MITYRQISANELEEVKRLYAQMGWTAYLADGEKLRLAWENSLFALGAFDGERLVGFVRCLGDGEHTVLIQDLLVAEEYRRRKIGKTLMKAVFERFEDVRQKFVVTDLGSPAIEFYRDLGMNPLEKGGMTAFFRL